MTEFKKKSANKLWKESGTSLSFKEWIEREKWKNADGALSTPTFSADINNTIQAMRANGGLNPPVPQNTTLGIPNYYLYIGAGVLLVALAVKWYNSSPSKAYTHKTHKKTLI
jgi:hypothetical protein